MTTLERVKLDRKVRRTLQKEAGTLVTAKVGPHGGDKRQRARRARKEGKKEAYNV